MLTEDSHTGILILRASSAAGSCISVQWWGESGQEEGPQEREGLLTRGPEVLMKLSLSESTSKTVFTPAEITLATSRSKGILVFRSVLWWGSLEI